MKKHLSLFILLCGGITYGFGQSGELTHLKQSLPVIQDSTHLVDALNRIGILLYEKNIDSTFYYTKRARAIADRLHYAKGQADALNNLGIVYSIKGNIQQGLRYYNEAYNLYQMVHDSANAVQARMNIAIVYDAMGRSAKAFANYHAALEAGKKLRRDSVMSLVIYSYFTTYPNRYSIDSLNYYIHQGRQTALKYKDSRMLLAFDQLEADNAIKNNQRAAGLALLQQTAAKALDANIYSIAFLVLVDLGDRYAQTDKAVAARYYQQGLDISQKKGSLVDSQMAAMKLAALFGAQKDFARAYYFSQKYQALNSLVQAQENISGVDYIDYAVQEQQLEASRSRSRYQVWLLAAAGLICMLTIGMLLLLWRNWKRSERMNQALRQQFDRAEVSMHDLEEVNKNYARLLKVVAHDLRNPIGAVGVMAAMLAENSPADEDQELIHLMRLSVDNSLSLINDLLKTDLERQFELDKKEIYLDSLMTECVQLLRFKAKDKNQQLIFTTSPKIKLLADREKLWRVANNLIINAIKFSPEGSTILIDTRASADSVLTRVKDMGIGIPANIQHKIFDPFTTARRKGTGGEQPFGLGLYISKQIVEAHNGKIWFTSEPEKGTEFFVDLPYHN